MDAQPNSWHTWAQLLQRWGGCHMAAMALEAAGPLTFVGAQMVYIGQPILKQVFSPSGLNALAEMLEDPQQAQAFAAYLRQCA
jgi:hypothetical protein